MNEKSRDLLEWHMIDEPLQSFSDYADYIQRKHERYGREVSRKSALQEAAADWCAENLLGRKVDGEPDASGRNYSAVKALFAHNTVNARKINDLLRGMINDRNNTFAENYAKVSGTKGLAKVPVKPYTNNRLSYRKGLVEAVWERCKGEDGKVHDPNTGEVIEWEPGQPRDGVWDMGHIQEEKYSIVHEKYMKGEISLKEFLDWYNNPENYQVELPHNNRSHKFEKVGVG